MLRLPHTNVLVTYQKCHVCHTDEKVSDHKTFGREPSEDTISCETSPENRR